MSFDHDLPGWREGAWRTAPEEPPRSWTSSSELAAAVSGEFFHHFALFHEMADLERADDLSDLVFRLTTSNSRLSAERARSVALLICGLLDRGLRMHLADDRVFDHPDIGFGILDMLQDAGSAMEDWFGDRLPFGPNRDAAMIELEVVLGGAVRGLDSTETLVGSWLDEGAIEWNELPQVMDLIPSAVPLNARFRFCAGWALYQVGRLVTDYDLFAARTFRRLTIIGERLALFR